MFERNKMDAESDRSGTREAPGSVSAPSSSSSRGNAGAIIGRSIQINGDVKGDEDLLIEGDVSGTVELKNHALTVGKEGKVKADIYARSITVDGTTDGDLFASERIAIRATAQVRGNLLAPRISLEDGAHFKGAVEMDKQAVEKAIGSPQPQSSSSSSANKPAAQAAKPGTDSSPATGQPSAAASR